VADELLARRRERISTEQSSPNREPDVVAAVIHPARRRMLDLLIETARSVTRLRDIFQMSRRNVGGGRWRRCWKTPVATRAARSTVTPVVSADSRACDAAAAVVVPRAAAGLEAKVSSALPLCR